MDSGGFQFWDSLTAAIFADESLAAIEEYDLQVVEQEGLESGYTKPTEGGAAVRVAVGADRERFERLLVTILSGQDQ